MNRTLQITFHCLAIALFAFGLRHVGWEWDQGSPWSLHPDERHMVTVTERLVSEGGWLNTETSGMNPYNREITSYVYGTLPLKLTHWLSVEQGKTGRREILEAGRLLSALWSTGTVVLVYLLTLKLASARWASLAGALMAITVLPIQQAHFYTVDSAGVFFATLCIGLGVWAVRESRVSPLVASGAVVGLAMACRLNLGLLAFWVMAAAVALAWKTRKVTPLAALAGGGVLALILFRVFQPYAFDATGFWPRGLNPQWLEDLAGVRAISHGEQEVPYTLQWVNRIPWGFALSQLVVWGMGWPLGLLGLGATGLTCWRYRHHLGHWQMLLALWPVLLIGYHGHVFLHTMRYALPAYPALIVLGILVLRRIEPMELRRIVVGVLCVPSLLYAFAFLNLYREPHPRIEASQWLYQQLPYGGVVASEHWDDALPLRLEGAEDIHAKIEFRELKVYERETPEKLDEFLRTIDEADFLVLSSTRASYTIPRLELRYPVMTRFYQRLAEGGTRSGLREVARFHKIPQIGGWGLDTLYAEEAFRVYDHPLVRIYEKTPVFSVDALRTVLTEDIDYASIPDIRYRDAGRWNNGWLTPDEWEARQRAESWSDLFPPAGIGNQAPLLTWVLVLLLLGVGSAPLCHLAFPHLPDRGLAVSRLVGIMGIAFAAWLPAAWGWLPFGTSLGLACLLFFGLAALRVGLHHEELLTWLRKQGRGLWVGEGVFWGVFGIVLLMRWLQPDLWHPWAGGEKPMDFAFLNATAQTPFFPAPQPWLSGAYINYYTYGFVWTACLIRATGISPDIAYNLAVPTFAALAASAVYSLAACGVTAFRSGAGRRLWRLQGVLAVGLTLLLGNLGQFRWWLSNRTDDFLNAGYWNASRAIGVPDGEIQPITEFPFFTVLYGDLHAHLMALPMAMLAMLCSWQFWRRPHPLRLLLCALALGGLWITNAWDFPIQAAIFAFCCLARIPTRPPGQRLQAARSGLGWLVLGLVGARVLFLPAHWHSLSHPAVFEIWDGSRSGILDLLTAHGVQLLPLVLLGVLMLFTGIPWRRGAWTARGFWLACLAGCLVLIVGVEFFRLSSDIGRMNTVFKFYYQVWWILSLVNAILIGPILFRRGKRPATIVFLCFIGFIWLLGALYPLTAPAIKRADRFWVTDAQGWDGLGYLYDAELHMDGTSLRLAEDLAGIHWLRDNARPFDILLEAHRPEYQWGARMSWHTGLPTVLGWNWHMRQQRPRAGAEDVVWRRAEAIRSLYTTTDPETARRLLGSYQVTYVVAGELESLTYGSDHRKAFETWPFLERVFEHGSLRIYRLRDPDSLGSMAPIKR